MRCLCQHNLHHASGNVQCWKYSLRQALHWKTWSSVTLDFRSEGFINYWIPQKPPTEIEASDSYYSTSFCFWTGVGWLAWKDGRIAFMDRNSLRNPFLNQDSVWLCLHLVITDKFTLWYLSLKLAMGKIIDSWPQSPTIQDLQMHN